MGIVKKGILGPIQGKVGQVIFYTSKGINIARSIGDKKEYEPSEALKANNNCFGLLSRFLKKVKPFVKLGFGKQALGTSYSYHNLATAYNMKNAMEKSAHGAIIHFDKLLLSNGNLMPASAPEITLTPEGLRFNWESRSLPYETSQHRAMLLAYFPELEEAIINTDGAKREDGTDVLYLEDSYHYRQIEVYIAFRATDSNEVSNSKYLGRIN